MHYFDFHYSWEQRKFSELYAKSSEKNDGSIGMDKNITVATMQFKEDVKVSTAEYLKTYYTFNFGDIAFEGHQSKEFRYGRFVENDIGNGIVSHIFAVFRPIREYDLHFWKYAINNEALMQRILSRSTKASTMMHDLVTNDFLNETFLVPSLDEQRRIGAFLDTLDNLITLHQRKCQIDGCRFQSPLAITWEQRKLGEVAKYRNGKAHENCIDESGKYIVVNSKFVSTNGTVIKHSNMQNEPLAQNEIAFVLSDVPNGRAIARTFLVEENDKYTLNQRIAGITSSENTYPYFLHILMNRHPYFLAFDDGVKQTNLSVSDVLNFETYYPEYEEQKQIGEYFRNLDRLITLHQCE